MPVDTAEAMRRSFSGTPDRNAVPVSAPALQQDPISGDNGNRTSNVIACLKLPLPIPQGSDEVTVGRLSRSVSSIAGARSNTEATNEKASLSRVCSSGGEPSVPSDVAGGVAGDITRSTASHKARKLGEDTVSETEPEVHCDSYNAAGANVPTAKEDCKENSMEIDLMLSFRDQFKSGCVGSGDGKPSSAVSAQSAYEAAADEKPGSLGRSLLCCAIL